MASANPDTAENLGATGTDAVRSSRVIDTAAPIEAAPLKSRIESEFG